MDMDEQMKTIFVVTEEESDYDSHSSIPILATSDKTKAEAKVAEMEKRKVRSLDIAELVRNYITQLDEKDPRPQWSNHVDKVLPFFKGKKKEWTLEQKAGYNKVVKENQEASQKAGKPMSDWITCRYNNIEDYKKTFSEQEQTDMYIREHHYWDIEEIPFAE